MTFDVQQATDTYINSLGIEALAKATAYTSGSHWILLWGFLISALTTWVFVKYGILNKIDAKLNKKSLWLRSFVISGAFIFLSSLLMLPWSIYSDWWREVSYGKTSQPIEDFLSQGGISLLLSSSWWSFFLWYLFLHP